MLAPARRRRFYPAPTSMSVAPVSGDRPAVHYDFRYADTVATAMVRGGLPITFARTGTANYWDSSSVLQTAAENVARFDHDPSDGSRRGLLIEEARTNSCLYSRTLDNGAWVQSGTTTPTANTTGIDGVSNSAYSLTDNNAAAEELQYQDVAIANDGNSHVVSCFVKKVTTPTFFPALYVSLTGGTARYGYVMLNTATGVTATSNHVPNHTTAHGAIDCGNWWRVWVVMANNTSGNTTLRTHLSPATCTTLGTYDNATTGTTVYDQVQVELNVGSTGRPSSPIITTDSAVTRNAETATVSLTGLALNPFGVSASYECGTSEDGTVLELGDGTADERIIISSRPATGNTGLDVTDGGVAQAAIAINPDPAYDTAYKLAFRAKTNDMKLYTDAANGADTSATMPTVTTLYLGGIYDGSLALNGWLRELKLWDYDPVDGRLAAEVA